MSRLVKIITYIQILAFVFLALCNVGLVINCPKKPVAFPCKDHTCGCKSEADCMTHCCCSSYGNQLKSQDGAMKQNGSFQAFMSSVKCKSGRDVITFTNTELKYIQENPFKIPQITFLCYLAGDTLVHLKEPTVSPPEKPPRYLT